MAEKSTRSTRSVKVPRAVYDRLAGAARDLRIEPDRFLELAMRRVDEVRLVVHAELVAQVSAEYATAVQKVTPSSSAPASSPALTSARSRRREASGEAPSAPAAATPSSSAPASAQGSPAASSSS